MLVDTLIEGINVLKLIGEDSKQQEGKQKLLVVADLPNRGRGYIANKDIPAGTLIHVAQPLSTAVSQEWLPETCIGCFDFTYPKRMKIKLLSSTEDTLSLLHWWQQQLPLKKKQYNNKSTLIPLRHGAFCTDQCKQHYLSTCTKEEWYTWLTCMYRLEHYQPQDTLLSQPTLSSGNMNDFTQEDAYDITDDQQLRIYLNKVWSLATVQPYLVTNDIDDDDLTMCRFMASCLVKRKTELITNSTSAPGFEAIWEMQDNELAYFRHTYYQQSLSLSTVLWLRNWQNDLPDAIKQTIQLYLHFMTAMTSPIKLSSKGVNQDIPVVLGKNEMTPSLFRAIYYREMANSFGLWEQQSISKDASVVTDDLELLGFGIYPSAVYFNHSCDANAIKLRHGRQMQFYTKQAISQGEEVCISYGDVDASLLERQQRLLDHYYFLCSCPRCVMEQQELGNDNSNTIKQ
ncbi:uncharacterized protein BX664DRAFT_326010 [Halteromyces radiatus]|uniref:uncharacterized protein n=1 Tax=Halteromyces radiatus TaxID=101107 RepID=UPI00221FC182|nr:uncharacterized protein BX664DRAFT_326010 [Halteromyces radiatus]KAI8097280.1 hypothetical protein BX664DRAFT_326010 [Halteromyces radiatus]